MEKKLSKKKKQEILDTVHQETGLSKATLYYAGALGIRGMWPEPAKTKKRPAKEVKEVKQ